MQVRQLPLHVRLIQNELDDRKRRNPRYSMRALAQFLEMDAGALSRILANKQDLSLESCRTILMKIGFTPPQARLFIASISEDKRNRAHAILTRALEPRHIVETDSDPRFENIIDTDTQKPLAAHDVYSLEGDLVSIMDLEGRFLHANEAVAKILGVIPCDLIGKNWPSSMFDVQTPALLEKQQAEVVNSKLERTFEFTVGRRATEKTLRRTITPVLGADGGMTAFISTIRDVTWDRFLHRAAAEVHSSLQVSVVLEKAVKVSTPVFADGCAIHLTKTSLVSAHHRMNTKTDDYATFIRPAFETLESTLPKAHVQLLSKTESQTLTYADRAPTHAIISPLRVDGESAGTVLFLSDRPYRDLELTIAENFADSVASALRNANQFAKHA